MLKITFPIFIAAALLLAACKQGIKAEKLYGDWKYIRVEKLNTDDYSDTTTKQDLIDNLPHISFSKDSQLTMYWGGKIFSHGSFSISGNNINYTEQLPGGKHRTFPFWVSKLDDQTIVFETMNNDGSRVTATKR